MSAEYNQENNWLYADWKGIQTVDTIKEGGLLYVDFLKQTRCPKLLNDNRHVIGPWTMAQDWIASIWTPMVIAEGLRCFAYLIPHAEYAKLSAVNLHARIAGLLEMRMFEDYEEATEWLKNCKPA